MHFYSVTPETAMNGDLTFETYNERLVRTIRKAEENGFNGILVPHNHHEIDPWMVASRIGSESSSLRPLIATQPRALPPHTAAQAAAAYAAMYGRPLDFNLVAGASPIDLASIGDTTSKEDRYDRLRSWALVVRKLLRGETVNWDDEHFTYRGFSLSPRPEVLAECRFFMAGSSATSQKIAAEVADVAVTHPLPVDEWITDTVPPLRAAGFDGDLGVRLGIIARPTNDDAWAFAYGKFPRTWRGNQEAKLKTISTNSWSQQLAKKALTGDHGGAVIPETNGYWLGAFVNGGASAPMLVGDYGEVAAALNEYAEAGVRHIILTGNSNDEYEHVNQVIGQINDCP